MVDPAYPIRRDVQYGGRPTLSRTGRGGHCIPVCHCFLIATSRLVPLHIDKKPVSQPRVRWAAESADVM